MLMNLSYSGYAVEVGDDTKKNLTINQVIDESEQSELSDKHLPLSPVCIDYFRALQKRSKSIRVTASSVEGLPEIAHESYSESLERERLKSETYIREIKQDIPHDHERSENR